MTEEASGSSKFGQSNISTLVAMEEPEECVTLYAWKDGRLKKLPYDERKTNSGQRIKTFYTFSKEEKVIIVTVDKQQMSLSISTGIITNGELEASEPEIYFVNKDATENKEYIHRVPVENPVLFFSLNFETFGEEIKPMVARDPISNEIVNEYKIPYGRFACAGMFKKK